MWGKVLKISFLKLKYRITPTHVGKRHFFERRHLNVKDHPHPCGEKFLNSWKFSTWKGSPPPMWGKGHFQTSLQFRLRITPTHVGKSLLPQGTPLLQQDHPHPCGEKLKRKYICSKDVRITPTHVGKSRYYS